MDGLRSPLLGDDSPWVMDTSLYAFIADSKQRCVHWILDDEKDRLKEYLIAKTHAVIVHQTVLNTASMRQMINVQVQTTCLRGETKVGVEGDTDVESVFAVDSTFIAYLESTAKGEGDQVLC